MLMMLLLLLLLLLSHLASRFSLRTRTW